MSKTTLEQIEKSVEKLASACSGVRCADGEWVIDHLKAAREEIDRAIKTYRDYLKKKQQPSGGQDPAAN